ncbi:hypothetical protein A4A49_04200 [Nicotiana attenuata]|nr:hypothetical protein A4A49_04200 [Nicotiana attenuata]
MEILNVFLNEKDTDDIQTQPPQQHHEKVDKPNRTNSAIAMETVMSFFSRYNSSHLSVLEDIQDEMPYNVKDIEIDSIQTAYTFPDISHLSEASEMKKPRSPHPPQITNATKTKQTNQKKFEEEEEEIEDDSLEATWKAITNKKKELNKSLTFNDALSMSRIGGLRGDISSELYFVGETGVLAMASTKVQRIMTQPINLIFRFLQSKARIQIWLFEQKDLRIEGRIIGFDEYMNLVLDDAEEVNVKKKSRKQLGRILLKGDNITLMMNTGK